MSDELPKKVFSVPPPPTDEIDSEWGGKGADESGKASSLTATEAAERNAAAPPVVAPGADAKLKADQASLGPAGPGVPATPPAPLRPDQADTTVDSEDEE